VVNKFIINSTAPVRISLCNGGDTDYYIKKMGWGNIINATLSTHGYRCLVEPKNQEFINYTYINNFSKTNVNYKITNLNTKEDNLKLITTTIKIISPNFKGNLTIITNVPERSGLGGSSSLLVALIKSLMKMNGKLLIPEEIAEISYKIEREILGIGGGYQDQWAAAFGGGVNYLEFRKNNVFLEPLWLHEDLMNWLEKHILLFYLEPRLGDSGTQHKEQEKNFQNDKDKLNTMLKRRENVLKTRDALLNGNIYKFANLIRKEHYHKNSIDPKTTTSKSGFIYQEALDNGAIAGKISGAGRGGCAIFITEIKNRQKIIERLKKFGAIHIPIKLQRLHQMGE